MQGLERRKVAQETIFRCSRLRHKPLDVGEDGREKRRSLRRTHNRRQVRNHRPQGTRRLGRQHSLGIGRTLLGPLQDEVLDIVPQDRPRFLLGCPLQDTQLDSLPALWQRNIVDGQKSLETADTGGRPNVDIQDGQGALEKGVQHLGRKYLGEGRLELHEPGQVKAQVPVHGRPERRRCGPTLQTDIRPVGLFHS